MDYKDIFNIPVSSKAVIIIGMGPQALYLLRELNGLADNTYLIGKKSYYGYLSKYGKKIIAESEGQIVKETEKLLKKYGSETPVFASGGSSLELLLNHDFPSENIYPKPLSIIRCLNKKEYVQSYLKDNGIGCQLEVFSWHNSSQLETFPVLAKWNSTKKEGFKVYEISNLQQLEAFKNKYKRYEELIVFQKMIQNNKLFYFGGLFNDGKLVDKAVVEEVRQNPIGLASYIEKYEGNFKEQIESIVTSIISDHPVTGHIQFEFILDLDDGEFFMLECNARPWGSMDVLHHFKNKRTTATVNVFRDLPAIKRTSVSEIPKQLFNILTKKKMHFRYNDPLPFFAPIMNQFKSYD